ncbi:conjugal transfer protein TrbC (plasmid) [Azospirillum sp. TSA2s]|uniref:TrbC/VirB2 family protein n=1 Tax=Azospirillum sp. TSA2s TaxID=709810 RepID=UPI0010AACFE3|nr:TrbC/VirB2 family protein [Azospirillum sp. TSA2s]QCG92929.1 conjugal transfer protein TrbC [Azospirillum sp. TSA2s]
MRNPLLRGVSAATLTAALTVLLTAPQPALAAGGGGGGLPWEAPLQTFVNSLTGPVAFAISLLGIVVCGAMLIWGGEINEFARRFVMLVLVVALLVFATNILTQLFGVGAVIATAGAGVVLA